MRGPILYTLHVIVLHHLPASMHLLDLDRGHIGEGIERHFVFLLAVPNQLFERGVQRVRCDPRVLINFALSETTPKGQLKRTR